MNHSRPRLTRRQLLEGAAGLSVAGLTGCIGASTGSANTQSNAETDTASGSDHPGHGSESHSHDMVSEPQESREVIVNTARTEGSTEYHFDPHVTWINVGGTVTWRLESGTHTATAYHPGNDQPRLVPEGSDAWDSGTLSEEGETYEHTFDTEGVYHYLCKPHEQFGMIATVIVGKPHLEEQIALDKMPDNKPEEVHGKLKELNGMVREIMGEGHHDGTETDHHNDTGTDHHDSTETHHHDGGTETDHHNDGTETHHHDDETETDHHD